MTLASPRTEFAPAREGIAQHPRALWSEPAVWRSTARAFLMAVMRAGVGSLAEICHGVRDRLSQWRSVDLPRSTHLDHADSYS